MSETSASIESKTAHLAQTNVPDDPTATMPTTFEAGQPVIYVNGQYHQDMAYYTAQVAPYTVPAPDGRLYYVYGNSAPPLPSYPIPDNGPPALANMPDLHYLPTPLGADDGLSQSSAHTANIGPPSSTIQPCICMYCTVLNLDPSTPFFPANHGDPSIGASPSYTITPLDTSTELVNIPSQPNLYPAKTNIMPTTTPLPLAPNPPLFPSHSYSGGGASSSTSESADIGLDLGFDDLDGSGMAKDVPYPFNPTPFAIAVNSYPVDCNYADVSGGSTTPTASSTNHDLPSASNSLSAFGPRALFTTNPSGPPSLAPLASRPTALSSPNPAHPLKSTSSRAAIPIHPSTPPQLPVPPRPVELRGGGSARRSSQARCQRSGCQLRMAGRGARCRTSWRSGPSGRDGRCSASRAMQRGRMRRLSNDRSVIKQKTTRDMVKGGAIGG